MPALPDAAARLFRLLARFRHDRSGAIAVLGASFSLAAVGFAAIVADWGSLYLERRNQQGVTDLAALVAARNLDRASEAAAAVISANGISPTAAPTVTLGSYSANRTLAAKDRFVAGGTPTNAVRVTVPADARLFFGRALTGQDTMSVVTTATAAQTAIASFTIGSRLASLHAGALNKVFGALLGGNLSLTAMDYNALADAKLSILPFLDALATRSGASVGTYSELAATSVSVGDVISAIADVGLSGTSAATAGTALSSLLAQSNAGTRQLLVGKLVDAGAYGDVALGEGSALNATMRALPLLSAAATAANGTNQVVANFGSSIPGLLALTAKIVVGERPQSSAAVRIGDDGETVYTAQTRIRLDVQVAGTGLAGGPAINVPILVDAASASARITSLDCGDNPAADGRVNVMAKPSAADLWIGTPTAGWSNFSVKPTVAAAPIVTVPGLATVSASGHAAVANVNETALQFTWPEIQSNTVKAVSTTTPVSSLISSVVGQTTFSASALGLTFPLVAGATRNAVAALVAPIGPALDPILVSMLDALGVRIGEADVTVNGLRCDGSVLVN